MTAGLPGVGLGGIFYVLCALLMPLVELARMVLGQERRVSWGLIGRQWLIASGSLAAVWATGWLLSTLVLIAAGSKVGDGSVDAVAAQGSSAVAMADVYGVPNALAGLVTVLLLVLVLVGVQVLRLALSGPRTPSSQVRMLSAEHQRAAPAVHLNEVSGRGNRAA